jgi:predicted RNA-binding protein with TRAM domain
MTFSLNTGDLFTAEIAYVSNGGIAAVKHEGKSISIGPVVCEKGATVHLRYLGEETERDTPVKLAICLTDDVLSDNYDEYIRRLIDGLLLGKESPDVGMTTYATVDQVMHRDLAVSNLNDSKIWLGPLTADEGKLVKIEGVSSNCARVLNNDHRGKNYETRLSILAGKVEDLPVAVGSEYTTGVNSIVENEAICYVQDVPVAVPSDDVSTGQKVDIKITDFNRDRAIAEIVETYDETVRVENIGEWARLQWLQDDFGSEPLLRFTAEFVGVDAEQIPNSDKHIRKALIAEAIRHAIQAYSDRDNNNGYPRAHISGIRHWVSHKLSPILGTLEDDTDWFRNTLDDGVGPTLEFLGDVMKLKGGYYAPGKTRAIKMPGGDAILISGRSTPTFLGHDFDIQLRGLTRIITSYDSAKLEEVGIPLQSQAAFLGVDGSRPFDAGYLTEFITSLNGQSFRPADEWEVYEGRSGYQIEWGDDRFEATLEHGRTVSIWRVPIEFDRNEYWLRCESADDGSVIGHRVPNRYLKQVVFALDAISGLTRQVDIFQVEGKAVLNCEFSPPSAQMRWLAAIGAEFIEPRQNRLRWRFDATHTESVKSAFNHLAVTVNDTTSSNEIN